MRVSPEYLLMRNLPFCAASLALQLPALPSCSAPKLNSVEMAIGNQFVVLCGILGAAVASTPVMLRPKTEQYWNGNWQSICRSVPRLWRCSFQHSRHAPPQNWTVLKWQLAINLPFCAASLVLQLPALKSCSAPKQNSIEMAICNQSAVLCCILGATVASTPVMLRPKTEH